MSWSVFADDSQVYLNGNTLAVSSRYMNSGTTYLEGGTLQGSVSNFFDGAPGVLIGEGIIQGNLQNRFGGEILVGSTTAGGMLLVTGSFTQDAESSTTVVIGGSFTSNLVVFGIAQLDGYLYVNLLTGVVPSASPMAVIDYLSATGSFLDSFWGAGNYIFYITVGSTTVTLTAPGGA